MKLTITSLLLVVHLVNARIPDEPSMPSPILTTAPIITTTPTTSDQETPVAPLETCFYAEADLCTTFKEHLHDSWPDCKECMPHPKISNSLVCCNVTDIDKALSCVPSSPGPLNTSYWINLHIRNATLDELDVSHKFWKRLDSLVVTDGNVKKISKEFTKFSSPKCINVSNNNLFEITPRAFKELVSLQVLDISHNNLSMMPNLNSVATDLRLDIRKNDGMLCKSVLESIERGGFLFVDPEATSCLTNQTFNWFNSTDSIPLRQLQRMKQLQTECPKFGHIKCHCEAERMNYENKDNGRHLVFTAKVDCSGLGLTELPPTLPTETISLNISRNNITSLSAISDNPSYKNLIRLYADDNQISSILDLEGTDFIEYFDTLFLRRNQLKSIQTYLLSNTLDRNPNGRLLYLEGNKLHCDCNSAKVLRPWLLARQSHIPDYDRILCENIPAKVLELSETKLCQSPHDWTDYIYYLIAAEVLLLFALIMKVSYDYWIFKTAGYLPWPASKMPKLPCDWLCES